MKPKKGTNSKPRSLQNFRHQIDRVDGQIVALLSQRQKLVVHVARFKKRQNLPISQSAREKQLLASKRKLAKLHSLNPNFVVRLFKLIIATSKKIETKTIKG